jgi:hypothetical protein
MADNPSDGDSTEVPKPQAEVPKPVRLDAPATADADPDAQPPDGASPHAHAGALAAREYAKAIGADADADANAEANAEEKVERTLPEGADPGNDKGALGGDFKAGTVSDPGRFEPKETRIADRLAEDGAMVHSREPSKVDNERNPDSMVRWSPADEGTITEFKTLESGSVGAVQRNIHEGAKQPNYHGGGDVVIDGRDVNLSADTARDGFDKAQSMHDIHGRQMPEHAHFILGDGTMLTMQKKAAD